MKTHELKTHPQYFQAVKKGIKPFEIRENDREFKEGDVLKLREYDPETKEYTGEELFRKVTYMTDYGQKEGFVVLGIENFVIEPYGRSSIQIVKKIKELRHSNDDIFGFRFEALIPFLPFKYAREFLKEDIDEEKWKPTHIEPTRLNILKEIEEYIEFAWDKVENHRGLSADRSVTKIATWLWLLGESEDDFLRKYEITGYAQYGAPKLALVCNTFGFNIPGSPEIRRMIQGLPCCPDCSEGCGV